MRYSYEYKIKCVDTYRSGVYPETPEGVSDDCFRSKVRKWNRIEKTFGPDGLKHRNCNRSWTPEEKLLLVSQVLAGKSCLDVAISNRIEDSILRQWVHKYKISGYNGLIDIKKGRPPKEPNMKQKQISSPTPLTESEREELIRLRAENEYIKAENEVIKKRIALRQEKEAALLKAKKQQSSENSVKKDIS